jgi:hypothetical protein
MEVETMTATTTDRRERLLPGGTPRYVRCYDNGGETADRYTVVFTGRYGHKTNGETIYLEMSAHPFHPQGIGQHGSAPWRIDVTGGRHGGPAMGQHCHLGLRVPFAALPADCKELVLRDYCELWEIEID